MPIAVSTVHNSLAQILQDLSKTIVDCAHGYGHYPHPSVTEEVAIDFLFLHTLGAESPMLEDGLPGDLEGHCELY